MLETIAYKLQAESRFLCALAYAGKKIAGVYCSLICLF